MNQKRATRLAVGLVTLVIAGGVLAACATAVPTSSSSTAGKSNAATPTPSTTADITKPLTYLIEEEKLAYDVYTVLGDKWNLRSMQNITRSEASHESQVENLLVKYGITDPRAAEVGVFTNPDLQKLYDELIAQGSVSASAAIQVGITIEKTDIADIDTMLDLKLPADVTSVLNTLRSGSENHLAAFSRQQ